jgi:hypothetical protein
MPNFPMPNVTPPRLVQAASVAESFRQRTRRPAIAADMHPAPERRAHARLVQDQARRQVSWPGPS